MRFTLLFILFFATSATAVPVLTPLTTDATFSALEYHPILYSKNNQEKEPPRNPHSSEIIHSGIIDDTERKRSIAMTVSLVSIMGLFFLFSAGAVIFWLARRKAPKQEKNMRKK